MGHPPQICNIYGIHYQLWRSYRKLGRSSCQRQCGGWSRYVTHIKTVLICSHGLFKHLEAPSESRLWILHQDRSTGDFVPEFPGNTSLNPCVFLVVVSCHSHSLYRSGPASYGSRCVFSFEGLVNFTNSVAFQKRLQWFRWEFEKRRLIDLQLYLSCFRNVKRRMDSGIVKPCLSTKMWEEGPSEETTEIEMAYYVASPFSAGISTVFLSHTIAENCTDDVFVCILFRFPLRWTSSYVSWAVLHCKFSNRTLVPF